MNRTTPTMHAAARLPPALTLLSLAACASALPPRPEPAAATAAQTDDDVVRSAPPGPVSVYTSSKWGFETNTFILDAPDGLVLIDTQFLPSAAEEALEVAEARYGKKVVAAVVLHPNPDKFNGTATLQAHGVRVITSRQVASFIPEVHTQRTAWFYDRYQPDYPRERPEPEAAFGETTTLTLAGAALTMVVLEGPGCSPAHVVVQWGEHVFVGDLVSSGNHAWLEIGETAAWLKRLDEVRDLRPRFVHPGRGPSGGPELLDVQSRYLERVIALVGGESLGLPPDPERLAALRTHLEEEYPTYGYSVFLKIGLPAEWRRQARARAVEGQP